MKKFLLYISKLFLEKRSYYESCNCWTIVSCIPFIRLASFKKYQVAVVSGEGTIGLSVVKCLIALGASKVFMVKENLFEDFFSF